MQKIVTRFFLLLIGLSPLVLSAQKVDRIQQLQQKLDELSVTLPGLNQQVQLQVNGVSIQSYLIALGKANKLSISVDPKLNYTVSETFASAPASNVLTFLAKKYNLDITNVGTIIYVTPYDDPALHIAPPLKEVKVKYSQLENTLSLELNNDSLVAVAKKITVLSGRNISVPTVLQNKRVSGFMAGASFDAALEKLAYTNEIKVVKTSDNFYVFQPLEENEELYINGDKTTASRKVFKPAAPATGAGKAGMFIRTVNGEKLISVDAINAPIVDMVKQASQELNKNYLIYSEIKGNLTIHVNDVTYESLLSLLFKNTDYTYHLENGAFMIGDSKLESLSVSKFIQLQNRSADSVDSYLPAPLKQGIEIKGFKEQNTVIVSGTADRVAAVESFLRQMDLLVPNVMIEVTLIDVTKTRTVATGISAGVADSVKTGGTVLPGVNFTVSATSINNFLSHISSFTSVNLGHVVPNFYATIQALESNNNIDVRSVPKLVTLNGHPATMSIGNSVFYKNTTQNVLPVAATSQTIVSNVYTESKADLSIAIKPIVSGDDQVTLGIKVEISDFTSIPTDGSPPPKATSKFESSIRVNNEDMIVLGGIERTERDDSSSGIPILSRIPILKWIFSSKSKTNKKVVTLVFIKPTILH